MSAPAPSVTPGGFSSSPDESLMEAIRAGDRQAYTELVERHMDRVHSYLLRLTRSVHDAEDLTQEAFLRVWQKAGTYQPGRVQVATWIHRIAHNLCIDSFRRARETVDLEGHEPAAADGDQYEQQAARETMALLEAAIGRLPANQRAALLLCQVQGFSNAQAADIMNLKVRALESLLARARRTLKNTLAEMETGQDTNRDKAAHKPRRETQS